MQHCFDGRQHTVLANTETNTPNTAHTWLETTSFPTAKTPIPLSLEATILMTFWSTSSSLLHFTTASSGWNHLAEQELILEALIIIIKTSVQTYLIQVLILFQPNRTLKYNWISKY